MRIPVWLAWLLLAFGIALLVVEVLLNTSEIQSANSLANLWVLRMIPYVFFWIPIWLLFSKRGHSLLASYPRIAHIADARGSLKRLVIVTLSSLLFAGAMLGCLLLFVLIAWGGEAMGVSAEPH